MRRKKQFPMMPWFPQSFAASTRGWSLLERAVYRELLDAQWDMGPLPDDTEVLARIVHLSCTEFVPLFSRCASKFSAKNGKLINVRLEQHRRKSKSISTLRARIGSAGGKAKALANATKFATAKTNHLSLSLSEESESKSADTASRPSASAPASPRKQIFELGKTLLGDKAGSLISKAIGQSDEPTVGAILGEMALQTYADPRAYFMAAIKSKSITERFKTA